LPNSPHIFVSHNRNDIEWCNEFVAKLRQYGANVWYDEHNLGYEELAPRINAELTERPIFIAVLSPKAVASHWVSREVGGAIALKDADAQNQRVVLFVIAEKCDIPPLWVDFPRIPKQGDDGISPGKAAKRVADQLKFGSSNSAKEASETADDAWWEGRALAKQRRLEDALQAYERAIAIDPQRTVVWVSKGNVLKELGRLVEAEQAYEQALRLDPDNVAAIFNRACVRQARSCLLEALADYERVLELEPSDREAWNNHGKVLMDLGRMRDAEDSFQRALSVDPRYYETAWNNLIELLSIQGRISDVLEAQRRRDAARDNQ
jgi:tetratricopeptide (TPR) repeat protein